MTSVERHIVPAETSDDFSEYRRILVSPTVNTPEHFQGFGGFCGWPKICRLHNGDLFLAFSAGYWHASWPTPFERYEPPDYAQQLYRSYPWLETWDAPEGGRMMWMRSSDNGRSWTSPKAFPSVPGAYGVTDVIQLHCGTMVAVALIELGHGFTMDLPCGPLEFARMTADRFPMEQVFFRSDDDGEHWDESCRLPGPFLFMTTSHDFCEATDGSLMLLTSAVPIPSGPCWPEETRRFVSVLMRSEDRGGSWSVRSIVGSNDFNVEEAAMDRLPDRSLGFCSRDHAAWFQSRDEGESWEEPRQLFEGKGLEDTRGAALFKKGDLVVTPDGTVAVLYSGGQGGGHGRVAYSRDSGRTWTMPAPDRGYQFDPLAYYPDACVLEDGTILAVGDHQGFENRFGPYGAEVTAMRFRIRSKREGEGIELLPIETPGA